MGTQEAFGPAQGRGRVTIREGFLERMVFKLRTR